MPRMKQLHHPDFSLWQSAIDQTIAKHKGGQTQDFGVHKAAVQRPDTSDPMVAATATVADHLEAGESLAEQVAAAGSVHKATEGVGDVAKYCSSIWWEIAKARLKGDTQAEQAWKARLGPFTTCDTRYAEAAEQYVDYYKVKKEKAPYKVWQKLDDFIIDGKLPATARVAILGDWGTGQQDARSRLSFASFGDFCVPFTSSTFLMLRCLILTEMMSSISCWTSTASTLPSLPTFSAIISVNRPVPAPMSATTCPGCSFSSSIIFDEASSCSRSGRSSQRAPSPPGP